MEEITNQKHQRCIENILQNIAYLQAILNYSLFEIISNEYLNGVKNAEIQTFNDNSILEEAQKYLPNYEIYLLMPSIDEYIRLKIKNYRRDVMLQNKFNNIVSYKR